MKGDKMDAQTNRRWIALALIGMVAVGARRESTSDIIRRLEAEVRLLKAQVRSLKRKLVDKKPIASSSPASKPVRPLATITPKGARVFSYKFTVYEHNPKWWTDAQVLQDEMTARARIRRLEPKQGLTTWLARHKDFVGKKIQWPLIIVEGRYIKKDVAAAQYISTNKRLERMTPRDDRYKSLARELAQWKAIMTEGGARLVLRPQKDGGLRVMAIVAGVGIKGLKVGQRYTIKGRIAGADTNIGLCTFDVHTAP